MKTKSLAYIGVLTAIAFVLTKFISFPIFGGFGYVHLGDSIMYLAAFLFGAVPAVAAGAAAGAIADAMSFPIYIIPTLIIKTLMAFAAARIYKAVRQKVLAMALALAAGSALLVAGYYIADSLIFGNWLITAAAIPSNALQALFSVPIPCILTPILKRRIKTGW